MPAMNIQNAKNFDRVSTILILQLTSNIHNLYDYLYYSTLAITACSEVKNTLLL